MRTISVTCILSLCMIILFSGCSQVLYPSSSAMALSEKGVNESITNQTIQNESDDIHSPEQDEHSINQDSDMVAFEGVVFVATTELNKYLWQVAGWQISSKSIDTNNSDIPNDCTLYPHDGVSDQWIGSCEGYILVPRNGAKHIAVMVTDTAGSTNMVQIAP